MRLSLGSYILRRLGWSVFVLVGLSMLIFVIARIVPGDPARMALGPRASQEAVDNLREEMHLNEPLHVQYFYWAKDALHGDFGRSLSTKRPVTEDIVAFLPATIELVLVAGIIHSLLGVLLGILAASNANTWVDGVIRLLAYVGIAIPAFVFAIVFMLVFGYWLELFPTAGRISTEFQNVPTITRLVLLDSLLLGNMAAFWDGLKHLILPGVALAMSGLSQEARITRASMVDNLDRDYIALTMSQGVPRRTVMAKYLLKPSLIPTVSIVALDVAATFGNAFLVELIYNWPGLSRYGITAMLGKDLNAISAVVIILGIVFVTMNILTDIAVSALDPRIRLGGVKQ